VLYAVEDNLVYALDAASGLQLWITVLDRANSPACGQPAVAAGVVYLRCNDGSLYALDATSGANLWSSAVPGNPEIGSTAVGGGTIYVTTDSASAHGLVAISTSIHAQEWSFTTAATVNAPAPAGSVVYAVTQDGILRALNAVTGALLWSKQLHDSTGAHDTHGVSVADGVAYTMNANGVAYAFNACTGAQLWRDQAGNTLQATPVIANGIVYIGTRSGGAEAFAAG
jgi:eukaryotic-like serine/threonine-protein kinase